MLNQKLNIIKIGGNIIDDEHALNHFLHEFALLDGLKILVHGGGKLATELSSRLGIETKMISGRRITDNETLKIIVMVYAGLVNKQIVSKLQSHNCNAIGICGADANIIPAHKRDSSEIDFGWVGDIDAEKINTKPILDFFNNGLTPVFAPVTHDENGQLLNTNADTIVSSLAVALSSFFEVSLYYFFEKKGVLKNTYDENSVISQFDMNEYSKFKNEGIISNGMIPKLDNAFDAIAKGVNEVIIGHASQLKEMVNKKTDAGTRLIK